MKNALESIGKREYDMEERISKLKDRKPEKIQNIIENHQTKMADRNTRKRGHPENKR